MKKINLIFTVFTLFLVSCSSEISGEYSGSDSFTDFEITLKEDGTWEKTSTSSGNSPFGVAGGVGRQFTTYGTWETNNEKTILFRYNNTGSIRVVEYKIEDGLFGYSFKNSTYGSFD